MNRVSTLFESKSIVIERFDHPEHCSHQDPKSEQTADTVVTFVESGAFEVMQDRQWWRFDPGDVLVSTPGLRRTYHHLQSCPNDVCLSVKFTADVVEGGLGRIPQDLPSLRITTGVTSSFAYRWLIDAVRGSNSLDIESAAFHCAVVLGPHRWERPSRLSGVGAHARKIRNACLAIATHCEEDHSLTSLSAEAVMSPFYFARVFSELVGEPPHRYLLRTRLSRAACMLHEGAQVAEAAVKSGFADVNHFSKLFRRHYGMPPSRYSS
ncbi:MAG TPA: AraC family transcriptional regulator [Pyrinomonadaceae bacterium]